MHLIRDRDSRALPLLVLCATTDDRAGTGGGGGAASEAAGQEEGDMESICTGNASNSSSLSLIHAANAGMLGLGSFGGFGTTPPQISEFGGLNVFDNGAGSSSAQPPASVYLTAPFASHGKVAVLHPLEISPPVGAQPTLYQKRTLRRNAGEEEDDKKRKAAVALFVDASSGGGDTLLDDGLSIDASGLNYDSEDAKGIEESVKDGKDSNANNSTVIAGGTGNGKGKRKGYRAQDQQGSFDGPL